MCTKRKVPHSCNTGNCQKGIGMNQSDNSQVVVSQFTRPQVIALLDSMSDRPIAFNRHYVSIGCGITGALMLSQMMYWSKRTKDRDGYFYKTQEDWEIETGMTRREQETARKRLRELGFITELKRGVPCKLHYKVDLDSIYAALIELGEKCQSSMAESDILDCTDEPNNDGGIRHTITENTTKNTTEITTKKKALFSEKENQSNVSHENKPQLNLTDKQKDMFANKLANDPNFGSVYAEAGETARDFESRIHHMMQDQKWLLDHLADLQSVGYKSKGAKA